MGKIIRVNLGLGMSKYEKIPKEYKKLGGKGLTSQIIIDEVDPVCEALGQRNKLVIAPGLLSGTNAPSSGRLSVGSKSPLTGGIKESNAGGTAARALARLGIKAIIIEEKPSDEEELKLLLINNTEVKLVSAESVMGLGNYETMAKLREKYGSKVTIMSIGQAGEFCMATATIAVSTSEGHASRHCGRGGLGAVLGSKKIKAIVIDDSHVTNDDHLAQIVDLPQYREVAKEWAKEIIKERASLTKYGTTVTLGFANEIGGLPTKNFRYGAYENADKINAEALRNTMLERGGKAGHACSAGCVIRCSNVYNNVDGEYLTSGLEYETIALFGSNLCIDDLDTIATLDRLCDDFGIDTMDTAGAIAGFMEANIISFGDKEKTIELVEEVGTGSLTGRVIGQGAYITGKVLGIGRVAHVKGQYMAAYDPRCFKGTGISYMTSTMGADHTSANMIGKGKWRNVHKPDQIEGQIEANRDVQYITAAIDSLGLCIFVGCVPVAMEYSAKLLTAMMGEKISSDDVIKMGIQNICNEIKFNKLAGIDKIHHRLPEFMEEEKLGPVGYTFDIPQKEISDMFDEDYSYDIM